MVTVASLWLPIVLSAVVVFVASSILHMVLTYHRSDYKPIPGEEKVMAAMRQEGLTPGQYHVPHCTDPKEMSKPEVKEKFEKGPVALIRVMPSGPPAMGKAMVSWFVFCLVIGIFVAYLTGRTAGPGVEYLTVFRIAGTVAFLGYVGGTPTDSIWAGAPWSITLKHIFDGLVYALLTAGVFGWLWPA